MLESTHRMGMLHSLLGAVDLASAGQARTLTARVDTAERRATELKRAVDEAREEAKRWKGKAGELTERVAKAEQAAERLPKVERELQQIKARDEEVVRLLAIDPHSPNEFRCNQIVRNIGDFYTTFGVTPNDALWLDPEQRVTIW